MKTKTCSACKQTKPVDMFRRSSKTKDKFQARCRMCDKRMQEGSQRKYVGEGL